MKKIEDILPRQVFEAIQNHLRRKGHKAEHGWECASKNEDTLTGDLGANLRTDGWRGVKLSNGEGWRWRVTYCKFGSGRGKGAEEKHLGADGIVEVEVMRQKDGRIERKGMIFQAKKHGGYTKRKLTDQVKKMERISPGSSAVFVYGNDKYVAMNGRKHLDSKTKDLEDSYRLGDFLAEDFLPCKTGKMDMYYDAIRKILILQNTEGKIMFVKCPIGHRIRIEVKNSIEPSLEDIVADVVWGNDIERTFETWK